jgi:hypothetical protein
VLLSRRLCVDACRAVRELWEVSPQLDSCDGCCSSLGAMISVVYIQEKARGALLMRDAQLRIKRNLDCSGLLITSPTTLAVWKLAHSVPDDLLLMAATTHATARLQIGGQVVINCR